MKILYTISKGMTLVEMIVSIGVFSLVLTSLITFFFTISDASYTQTAVHDVLSYHRELSNTIDMHVRHAVTLDVVTTTEQTILTFVGGDGVTRSFSFVDGALMYASSTESFPLVSTRVLVDMFSVAPLYDSEGVVRGVAYTLGVSSRAPDVSYATQTQTMVYLRSSSL